MANKPKSVPTGTIADPRRVQAMRDSGQEVNIVWEPFPAQLRIMNLKEFEIFSAASKYSGKSELAIYWMVMGNLDQPDYDEDGNPLLYNMSYTYHPNFLGAVIRLNEKDLAEWVDRARPYYEGVLGGVYTKNPAEFRFPSGARIFLGHAADSNAWLKYQGQNITRFLIEEAGQIPTLELFEQIRTCVRSKWPEMRAQILMTANPGGPGQPWLFDRYIEPKDADGNPYLHPETAKPIMQEDGGYIRLVEAGTNPFTGELVEIDRIWAPLYMTDNPHAVNNKTYIAILATTRDEKMRRAYLLGDWKAFKGAYFDIFKRDVHTYDPSKRNVMSWWTPSASLDWGYKHDSAAHKHKIDPQTKQHLIYDEFGVNHTDPVELGAALARWLEPELRSHGQVTIHVSHDLYQQRTGDMYIVEFIAQGAEKVIGKGSCYIPGVIITRLKEQAQMEGRPWTDDDEKRITALKPEGITFKRAPSSRAVGFQYLRSLMRTAPLFTPQSRSVDWDMALKIAAEGSSEQYANYVRSFDQDLEILPPMLISTVCQRLIKAIPKCLHDDKKPEDVDAKHFDGMDYIDSWRYLMSGVRDDDPPQLPPKMQHQLLMQQIREANPNLSTQDLIWMSMHHEEEEDESEGAFCMGRSSRLVRYMD